MAECVRCGQPTEKTKGGREKRYCPICLDASKLSHNIAIVETSIELGVDPSVVCRTCRKKLAYPGKKNCTDCAQRARFRYGMYKRVLGVGPTQLPKPPVQTTCRCCGEADARVLLPPYADGTRECANCQYARLDERKRTGVDACPVHAGGVATGPAGDGDDEWVVTRIDDTTYSRRQI